MSENNDKIAVCDRSAPWSRLIHPVPPWRILHEEARETDNERDFGGGEYCVEMYCPVCGHVWWKELPQ